MEFRKNWINKNKLFNIRIHNISIIIIILVTSYPTFWNSISFVFIRYFNRIINGDKVPLILAGHFNINFADKISERLRTFLSEKLNLKMNNDPQESTTKYGTTIDAVFSRYLENIKSQTYVSYFSYHKPIVSMIKIPE